MSIHDFTALVNFEIATDKLFSERRLKFISDEFQWIQSVASKSQHVYGLNTLTGHRDSEGIKLGSSNSQEILINSHLVPTGGPAYDQYESRCITVAKGFAVRNGGTGMSPTLTAHLLEAIDSPAFLPFVPTNQSYSSGDVIPGAYWARSLLNWKDYYSKNPLLPGEALALINGSFVHIGVAASTVPKLAQVKSLVLHAFGAVACLSGHDSHDFKRVVFSERASSINDLETLSSIVQRYRETTLNPETTAQCSVSIRSFPELIMLLNEKVAKFISEINYSLNSRSANPMYDHVAGRVDSQASFLLATLSADESTVIDGLLLTCSALVGGIQHLLSGRVSGIPIDGHRSNDPYGFIQVPKELMARLERLRLITGRRPFSAGASTSYGIEDLWTYGLNITELLNQAIVDLKYIALRTICICELLSQVFFHKKIFHTLEIDLEEIFLETLRIIEEPYSGRLLRSFDRTVT